MALEYLFKGLVVFATLSLSAVVIGRTGRSPYLSLLLLFTPLNIILLWWLAYTKWPKVDGQKDDA